MQEGKTFRKISPSRALSFFTVHHMHNRQTSFRSLAICSTSLALVFGLMAYGLLRETISGRAALIGYAAVFMAGLAAACAVCGPRLPRLCWLLAGFGLFYLWLAVPAVGLEAYTRSITPGLPELLEGCGKHFHESGWKWLLGLCALGIALGVRLLILCFAMRRKL